MDKCLGWPPLAPRPHPFRAPYPRVHLTFASLAIFLQDVPSGAGTLEAALRVLADEITGFGRLAALVQV